MENILKLHRKEAIEQLNEISDALFEENNILYTLNPNINVATAVTYCDKNGYATETEIGIYELNKPKQSFIKRRNPIISDKDFTQTILNMHHEYMHCIQKNQTFRQENLNEYERQQMTLKRSAMTTTRKKFPTCNADGDL